MIIARIIGRDRGNLPKIWRFHKAKRFEWLSSSWRASDPALDTFGKRIGAPNSRHSPFKRSCAPPLLAVSNPLLERNVFVEESPSGDTEALPPDEPSGFHSAGASGRIPRLHRA